MSAKDCLHSGVHIQSDRSKTRNTMGISNSVQLIGASLVVREYQGTTCGKSQEKSEYKDNKARILYRTVSLHRGQFAGNLRMHSFLRRIHHAAAHAISLRLHNRRSKPDRVAHNSAQKQNLRQTCGATSADHRSRSHAIPISEQCQCLKMQQ